MAEKMTIEEARDYALTNGLTVDLVHLVDADRPEGWTSGHGVEMFAVGQIAYVHTMGAWRRGVVTKVAKTRVNVALTTEGALAEARRYGSTVRVQNAAYPAAELLIDADREETPEPAAEAAPELTEAAEIVATEREAAAELEESLTTGSTVVRALERVWDRIREDMPELPEVVMITGSGTKGIGPSRWGHVQPNGWEERSHDAISYRHEMFIAGECLAKGARQVVQTMLHEAAHVLARVRDIQDTSRQGRWHNGEFRKLAEELGLEHRGEKAHPQHGYSFVTLTPGTEEQYAEVIKGLDAAIRITVGLPVWLGGSGGSDGSEDQGENVHGLRPPKAPGTGSSSNNLKLTCGCEEPRIIRASRAVYQGARIDCRDCGEAFLAAEDRDA